MDFKEELQLMIQKRIDYLNGVVAHSKTMIDSPYNGKHFQGYLAAIDGEIGEIKFLEKLLGAVKNGRLE